MASPEFNGFIQKLGMRKETGEKLWLGNIRSPQELAASTQDELRKIANDPVLLNTIFPVLQKFVFPITMASDPYSHAVMLLKREAGQIPNSSGNTQSDDTTPFIDSSTHSNATRNDSGYESRANRNGFATSMETNNLNRGGQNVTFGSNVDILPGSETEKHFHGIHSSIKISGGNFVQSAIMPTERVVYNNKGTTLKVKAWNNNQQEKAAEEDDMAFVDKEVFHVQSARVQRTDQTAWQMHRDDNSIYPNYENWGRSRALVINNVVFSDCPNRDGAAEDGKNMRNILQQMGFVVESHENKRKNDMERLLKDFASHSNNVHAPMSLVYIGTHGQRVSGADHFIGTDDGRIAVKELAEMFKPEACPHLREKPKIFLLQFCRKNRQIGSDTVEESLTGELKLDWLERVESDANPGSGGQQTHRRSVGGQDLADMIFSFATSPGTKAYRDTTEGSWYVTTLCKVFTKYAFTEHLNDMLIRVNNEVMKKYGEEEVQTGSGRTREKAVQLSELRSYLRKKVMFFPGAGN